MRTSGRTDVSIDQRITLRFVLPEPIACVGCGLTFPRAKPDGIVAAGRPVGSLAPDCRPILDRAAIPLCIRGGTRGGTLTKTDAGVGGYTIAALCSPGAIGGDTVAVTVVAQFPPAIAGVLRA